MNNEKLVDAIGLLDDEMITAARNPKIKRFPAVVKVVAAVLAILIVPAFLIVGGGQVFGFIGANSPSPEFRYAFTEEALMEICQKPMGSVCMTTDPPIYMSIGANPPEIHFADEEKIIFTTLEGIFVYNYHTMLIEKNYSLEKIGIPLFAQGDVTTHISIDQSGDYALLTSSENMSSVSRVLEYRILDFNSGKVEKIKSSDITDDFKSFETADNVYKSKSDSVISFEFYESKDFLSRQMVSLDGKDIFLAVDIKQGEAYNALLGYAEVVMVNPDGSFKTHRLFSDFSESVVK